MRLSPLLASLLSVTLAVLASCGKSSLPAPPPPQVGVVRAAEQSVPLNRDMVGRLSSYLSANVTARVSGVLVKRDYTEGSEVKQGQVLFEINPAYYQTQLHLAIGTLAHDTGLLNQAKSDLARYLALEKVNAIAEQIVSDQKFLVQQDTGTVEVDHAAVDSARVNLGYTKVTSPIDGIAGQQQVTVGALVGSSTTDTGSSGTLLTTVQKIDSLYVNFAISAADLVTMRQAQRQGSVALAQQDKTTVQIVLPNGSRYDQLGVLDFSDVLVNATTGSVNLRALVPNAQHELSPGMYVTLIVNFGQQNNVFLIPQQALQRDTVGAYVLTVDQTGKVVRKDVNSTDSYGNESIVTSGLAVGDKVIVTGLQGVQVGGKATAIRWQALAAPANAGSASAPARNKQ
jgi:membrane fusion protein, multidrug efflux system